MNDNLLIAVMITSLMISEASVSFITPFYPKEANSRGASSTQYGFAVGLLEIASIASSVPIGKLINRVSPRYFFVMGILIETFSLLMFGSLHLVSDKYIFLSVSAFSRILSGIGNSVINIGMFTVAPLMFPDRAGSLSSFGEAISGTGLIVGPLFGGLLYDFQGFYFPFLILACLHILQLPFACLCLPSKHLKTQDVVNRTSIFAILRLFDVWVCLYCSAMVNVITSMDFISFEPRMRDFHVSSSIIGISYSVSSVVYLASNMIAGKICDRKVSLLYVMLPGVVITTTGLAIFASSRSIFQIVSGLMIQDMGCAFMWVPSLLYMVEACIKKGFADDLSTRGAISGLFITSDALGGFVGYSGGGALSDLIGISNSYFVLTSICALGILFILISIFINLRRGNQSQKNEKVQDYGSITNKSNS